MRATIGRRYWLAILLTAVSCALPKVRYYSLEYPHAGSEKLSAMPSRLAIERFKTDQVLQDDRIPYRENDNEISFYEYQRWASPPADLVTRYFVHRLKDGGGYASVSGPDERAPSDFLLQGRIHHFEEVDRGKEVYASVSLEAELIDAKTRLSVWRGEAECERPVAERNIGGVVRVVHGCLEETGTKLLSSLRSRLENLRK